MSSTSFSRFKDPSLKMDSRSSQLLSVASTDTLRSSEVDVLFLKNAKTEALKSLGMDEMSIKAAETSGELPPIVFRVAEADRKRNSKGNSVGFCGTCDASMSILPKYLKYLQEVKDETKLTFSHVEFKEISFSHPLVQEFLDGFGGTVKKLGIFMDSPHNDKLRCSDDNRLDPEAFRKLLMTQCPNLEELYLGFCVSKFSSVTSRSHSQDFKKTTKLLRLGFLHPDDKFTTNIKTISWNTPGCQDRPSAPLSMEFGHDLMKCCPQLQILSIEERFGLLPLIISGSQSVLEHLTVFSIGVDPTLIPELLTNLNHENTLAKLRLRILIFKVFNIKNFEDNEKFIRFMNSQSESLETFIVYNWATGSGKNPSVIRFPDRMEKMSTLTIYFPSPVYIQFEQINYARQFPNLKKLMFHGVMGGNIRNSFFPEMNPRLRPQRELQGLYVTGGISAIHLARIAQLFPNLKELQVMNLEEKGFRQLWTQYPRLESLHIVLDDNSQQFSLDPVITGIRSHRSSMTNHVGSRIPMKEPDPSISSLENLRELRISDDRRSAIRSTYLQLSNASIFDGFSKLSHLEFIGINQHQFSDKGVDALCSAIPGLFRNTHEGAKWRFQCQKDLAKDYLSLPNLVIEEETHLLMTKDMTTKLMRFMSLKDLICCRQICRKWRDIATPLINARTMELPKIIFERSEEDTGRGFDFCNICDAEQTLLPKYMDCISKSRIVFSNFEFKEVCFGHPLVQQFLDVSGQNIQKLGIFMSLGCTTHQNSRCSEQQRLDPPAFRRLLMTQCPNLEELIIGISQFDNHSAESTELLQDGFLIYGDTFETRIKRLAWVKYQNENATSKSPTPALFQRQFTSELLKICPSLERLWTDDMAAFPTSLADLFIPENLKELTVAGANPIPSMLSSFNKLKLKKLKFRSLMVQPNDFFRMLDSQKDSLEMLVVENWESMPDAGLDEKDVKPMRFPVSMDKLEVMKLHFTSDSCSQGIDFQSVDYARQFPALKTMIFEGHLENTEAFFPKKGTPQTTLEEIQLPSELSQVHVACAALMFPNVKFLKVENLSAKSFRQLWTQWPDLSSLCIEMNNDCFQEVRYMDCVITGFGHLKPVPSIANFKKLTELRITDKRTKGMHTFGCLTNLSLEYIRMTLKNLEFMEIHQYDLKDKADCNFGHYLVQEKYPFKVYKVRPSIEDEFADYGRGNDREEESAKTICYQIIRDEILTLSKRDIFPAKL